MAYSFDEPFTSDNIIWSGRYQALAEGTMDASRWGGLMITYKANEDANGVIARREFTSDGKIPIDTLPSSVVGGGSTTVSAFTNEASFPAVGDPTLLYIDESDGSMHWWSTSDSAYIQIGRSIENEELRRQVESLRQRCEAARRIQNAAQRFGRQEADE